MRRAVFALTLVGTALLQAGCPTFPNDNYIYREGFQSCPSGCGWQRIQGEASNVSIVETLRGERGLQLRGETAVAHTFDAPIFTPSTFVAASSFALDLIARCDLNSALQVQISATAEDGSPQSYEPFTQTSTSWDHPHFALEAFPSTVFPEPTLISIDQIVILKTGPGNCEIDEIGIFFEDPFGFRE
jgi:hypothetical protein